MPSIFTTALFVALTLAAAKAAPKTGSKVPSLPRLPAAFYHALTGKDATCSAADQAKTKACLSSYFSAFGYDTSKPLPTYIQFASDSETILYKFGAGGIDIICSYVDVLDKCLGDLKGTPCMWREAFVAMYGLDFTEAAMYSTDFPIRRFECTHKSILINNYQCFMDVYGKYVAEVDQCVINMSNSIASGAEMCSTYSTYIDCLGDVYVNRCTSKDDLKLYTCDLIETALHFAAPGTCKGKLPACDIDV